MVINFFAGKTLHVPALPVALNGRRLAKRADPPRMGEYGRELLAALGYPVGEIERLRAAGMVSLP